MKHYLSRLLLTALLLTTSAWASPASRNACPIKSDSEYYFAKGALDEKNERADAFVRKWYSSQLAATNEPSLSCDLPPGRVFRFTWLRTFHHPVVVRVSEEANHISLVAIELDGAGGYEPGKVLRRKEVALSSAKLQELQTALEKTAFWSAPAAGKQSGRDGAEWIFEAVDKGTYRLVVRWSPERGPFRELGMQFLQLANWRFKDVY